MPLTHSQNTHTRKRVPLSYHGKPGLDKTHTHKKEEIEEATQKAHTLTKWEKIEANSLI